MRRLVVGTATAALLSFFTQTSWSNELQQVVTTNRDMVVTAHPLATEAAERVLRRGGTAVDAMVAAQAVLGLVEPQSSGLGGGAFAVYYNARNGRVVTFDAREKAPAAATEDRFVDLGFFDAWQSGLSVGVPGTPRLMEDMHRLFGRLPWRQLFRPAIRIAEDGFELSERTSSQVARLLSFNDSCEERLFLRDPAAFDYFVGNTECVAKPAGTLMTNIDYADTLIALARRGANAFYLGNIAEDIVNAVQTDPNIPGDMTRSDLANYDVVRRQPVCVDYRGYEVCGMGPPSSGAIAVGQILGILENFDLSTYGPLDVETVHLFSQAGRLAFADRGLYVGDSDFVTVPVAGLLDETYLAERAATINDNDMGTATAGTPDGLFDPLAPDTRTKDTGTSHLSIVDRYGNALSMTTTIESSLGNGVLVRGFLLNNELTDFSFSPASEDGTPVANRVQPNKRPRSSMSPTIVLDETGEPKLLTGSAGGSRIIGYTAQSIMNVIDFGLDPQEAVNVPHFMNRNGRTDIEMPEPGITLDYDAEALQGALQTRGYTVAIIPQNSGMSNIEIRGKLLLGGADPRRDGTVGGNSQSKPGDCDDEFGYGHDCPTPFPIILTTPDRIPLGNYGWALYEDGTKQWIDAACRDELDALGLETEVLEWAEISVFPDGDVLSCEAIGELSKVDDKPDSPIILVTPDKVADGNYGWVLFTDGSKQWVDPTCRAQLESADFDTEVLEWVEIAIYPDGAVLGCEDIIGLADHSDRPQMQATILVTPDKVPAGNYGWVRFADGTKQWVDAACRAQLESTGLDTDVLEWVEISAFADRQPVVDCDAIVTL